MAKVGPFIEPSTDSQHLNPPDNVSTPRPLGQCTTSSEEGMPQKASLKKELTKRFIDLDHMAKKDSKFIKTLIRDDAKIDKRDVVTGKTHLHEIAEKRLHVDIAKCLIDLGATVAMDNNGLTPFHVAAAMNYPKLIETLRNTYGCKAHIIAGTKTGQIPLHYAACNDALGACRALVKWMKKDNISIDVEDQRGRTPLLTAVEFGNAKSAKWLVEQGADVQHQDLSGRSCLTLMVKTMSSVAIFALDKYHEVDKPNRKEIFHLGYLVDLLLPGKKIRQDEDIGRRKAPLLEYIVEYGELDVIMHPVILKTLEAKWLCYGRKKALTQLAIYLLYITIWTALGIGVSWQSRYRYDLPLPDIWRILFWILAILGTAASIYLEYKEYSKSQNKFKTWKCKMLRVIEEDDKCYRQMSGPNPNKMVENLKRAESEVSTMTTPYFRDLWNILDVTVYVTNCLILVLHIIEVAAYTATDRPPPCCGDSGCDATADLIRQGDLNELSACSSLDAKVNNGSLSTWLNRLIAIQVIMMWLGIIKHLRGFRHLGPLIVMLGNILNDVGWFLLLFSIFYVAYVFAFWIIFGLHTPVNTMSTVDQILFSLYRITLVDEYQYEKMHAFDIVMTYFLVGTFLVISAVLCINILIALISDTFQRIYRNAKATAKMQQAAFIVKIEEDMTSAEKNAFKKFIEDNYDPIKVDVSNIQDYAFNDKTDFSRMRSLIDGNQRDNCKETRRIFKKIERIEEKLDQSLAKLSDTSSHTHTRRPNKDPLETIYKNSTAALIRKPQNSEVSPESSTSKTEDRASKQPADLPTSSLTIQNELKDKELQT